MVDPDILTLMISSVTVAEPADRDRFGKIIPGASITAQCRIEYDDQFTGGGGTNSIYANGIVYMDDVYPITQSWTLTLPDNGPTRGKEVWIVKVNQLNDDTGPYCTILYFGSR